MVLTPEERLLTLCARTRQSPGDVRELETLTGQQLDWAKIGRQVRRHGIEPLVDRALRSVEGEIPEEFLQSCRARARAVAMRNMQQYHELLRLLKRFEAKGIPVIPFKGPTLAVQAYGDVAYRPFVDLDILVPRECVVDARSLLEDEEYQPVKQFKPEEEKEYVDTKLGYEFINREKRTVVEVHWSFLFDIYAFELSPEEVWQRSHYVNLSGVSVQMMAPEDMLIYLCSHGTKHRWMRLPWIADVAEFVHARPDLAWDTVIERATALGCLRMVSLGLYLSQTLLGAKVPCHVRDVISNDTKVELMAEKIAADWLFRETQSATTSDFEVFRFHVKERERWRDRWPYIKHHLSLWMPRLR